MTAMRLKLQKELFDDSDEQLVSVANVTETLEDDRRQKDKKKKKKRVLCLVRTNDAPVYIKLYLLKKTDKELYKKKMEWQLRELKIVDAVDGQTAEIRLDLDERYSWIVGNYEEKEAFLRVLQKQCERYEFL